MRVKVIRDVRDLSASERDVFERISGWALRDNQRLIIEVVDAPLVPRTPTELLADRSV